jgi:pimeloyl-ACP methyl ester carboxylesterase
MSKGVAVRTIPGAVLLFTIFLWPTLGSAQDRFFDSGGVQIRYMEQGSGEPIVLVHGYTSNVEENWVDHGVMGNLAKDHRVIAFDLRGHGKSGKPHDSTKYGAELSRDIVRLMDRLDIARAHVVGYSFGASITAKLLTTNPERFLTATLGGSSGRRNWTEQNARNDEAEAEELERGLPYRSVWLRIWPTDQPPPSEEALREASRQRVAMNDPLAHAAMVRARQGEAVTDAQMAAVRVPALAIVGSADGALVGVKALNAAWPALKVMVVEGATHWGERGVLSRQEFIQAIRTFIAAHTTGLTTGK